MRKLIHRRVLVEHQQGLMWEGDRAHMSSKLKGFLPRTCSLPSGVSCLTHT